MKNIFALLFIITTLSHAQTESKYNFNLGACITEQEANELEYALSYFESQVQQRFGNEDLNRAIFSYLESLYVPSEGAYDLDPSLNKEVPKVLEGLKSSGLFDKIWIPLREADPAAVDQNGNPPDKNILVFNADGSFYKCVLASKTSSIIKRYISYESENPGFNFSFSARFIRRGLEKQELDNDLNRLVIALGFYYQFMYSMNNED
ncbi:hypothetical protein [Gilvibacter sediminis]|uniref:hypothetical protein n=1 Tax=Gilvibacter sediminis TaxID=379071 RepID=UPI0023508CC4|nr:hypothetical protein [Gilvibacter sediminis]MDC7998026.1 hypothetical protein [Gilvibacter sediminis]